jgi:hypothetical protein
MKNGLERHPSMILRPYQLLCIVCAIGDGDFSDPRYMRIKEALDAIREDPDMPITLRCNAHSVYAYQDAGTEGDTPEGAEYNRKRDLDVLQKLDLPPGSTLPARTLFIHLLKGIKAVSGICDYDAITSDAWKGCHLARSGNYEKGWAKAKSGSGSYGGLEELMPPRSKEEMMEAKKESVMEVYSAKEFFDRPHHLLCAVCQYGNGIRPPFPEDNLPEFLDIIRRNPDLPITLVQGVSAMTCAPCPAAVPKSNACVCGPNGSGGLYDELKDLNVLQKLGLTYGTTMRAGDLYKLVFERILTVSGTCALKGDNPPHSVWWDPCGQEAPPTGYEKGRGMLMREFT